MTLQRHPCIIPAMATNKQPTAFRVVTAQALTDSIHKGLLEVIAQYSQLVQRVDELRKKRNELEAVLRTDGDAEEDWLKIKDSTFINSMDYTLNLFRSTVLMNSYARAYKEEKPVVTEDMITAPMSDQYMGSTVTFTHADLSRVVDNLLEDMPRLKREMEQFHKDGDYRYSAKPKFQQGAILVVKRVDGTIYIPGTLGFVFKMGSLRTKESWLVPAMEETIRKLFLRVVDWFGDSPGRATESIHLVRRLDEHWMEKLHAAGILKLDDRNKVWEPSEEYRRVKKAQYKLEKL